MKDKKRNVSFSILIIFLLLTSIINFIINILYKNLNNDYITKIISSLLLTIFSLFFITAEYNNTKKSFTDYITILLLLTFLIFSSFNTMNLLPTQHMNKVKDFTNQSLTEVIKWSKSNHIKVEQIYEYSDITKEYKIISQSAKENTPLKNLKKFTVVVSEGPNPDKEIIIPNMISWNVNDVVKNIQKNHLNNVKIDFIESDKIRNTLIEQSKSGSVKRSDEINLKFSFGEEEISEVKLINLKNKTLLEAEIFFKQNKIDYEIEYLFSNKIKTGNVIKTNKEIGKILDHNEKIKIYISKGKEIKVPNLKKYDIEKITEWVIKNKLRLEFTDKYDDKISANKVISVNYNNGDIIEEKTLIKVILSKGKLVMENFSSLEDFKAWTSKYDIKYEEEYEFSNTIKSGDIISYSHKKGDTIKNGDTIVVKISQGEKTTVPNVVGKTKEEAIKLLEKAKINYAFIYEDNIKEKNLVLKQSLSANSEVASNVSITITLSSGKSPTEKSKNNNINNKNTNNNSNTSNNTTTNNDNQNQTTPTCDKSITEKVYIDQSFVESGNPNSTCNMIKNAYPNLKFNCTYQTGTGMSPGLLINSNSIDNHSFNHCDTITLKIAQS